MDFLRNVVLAAAGQASSSIDPPLLQDARILPSTLSRLGLGARLTGAVAYDEAQSLLALGLDGGRWLVVGNQLEVGFSLDDDQDKNKDRKDRHDKKDRMRSALVTSRASYDGPRSLSSKSAKNDTVRRSLSAAANSTVHTSRSTTERGLDAPSPKLLPDDYRNSDLDLSLSASSFPVNPNERPCLAFTQGDCYLIATATAAATEIVVWNLQLQTLHLRIRLPDPITTFQVGRHSRWIAVGLVSGVVRMVDFITGQISVYSIPYLDRPAGQETDRVVSTHELAANPISAVNEERLSTHGIPLSCSVRCLLFGPGDSNLILIVYENGPISLWDISLKLCVKQFIYTGSAEGRGTGSLDCVTACWRPDGEQFVAAYTDNQLVFWNIKGDWRSVLSTGSTKKEDVRKPALVRSVLVGSQTAQHRPYDGETHAVVQLCWTSMASNRGSVLMVCGGMPVSDSFGVACLFISSKYDLKPGSIFEVVAHTPTSVIGMQVISTSLSSADNTSTISKAPPSQPTSIQMTLVAVLDDDTCISYAIHDKEITPLSLPGSLHHNYMQLPILEGSITPLSGCVLQHMECSSRLYRDLSTMGGVFPEPTLILDGGQIRHKTIIPNTDLLCVVRSDKQFEFWSISVPTPSLVLSLPFFEWLPSPPVDSVKMDPDRRLLCVHLGPYVVYHSFIRPSDHDEPGVDINETDAIDDMMAKLDATIGQVLEDSAAISNLITHKDARNESFNNNDDSEANTTFLTDRNSHRQSHRNDIRDEYQGNLDPQYGVRSMDKHGHSMSVEHGSMRNTRDGQSGVPEIDVRSDPTRLDSCNGNLADDDSQQENKNVWFTSLDARSLNTARCWRPLFQVIHTAEVLLSEYADWMHILATATHGHIHFIDTITGREILTDELPNTPSDHSVDGGSSSSSSSSSRVRHSATAMCFVPLLIPDDPTPQLSLIVTTNLGTVFSYTVVIGVHTHAVSLQRRTLFTPPPSRSAASSSGNASSTAHNSDDNCSLYLSVLDDNGRPLKANHQVKSVDEFEQHIIVISRRSIRVLFIRSGHDASTEGYKTLWGNQHIVCARVAYIINDSPHVVAVTNVGRLLVYELPSLNVVAHMPLPDGIDLGKLHLSTITTDGRLSCWMVGGFWEMFGILSDLERYPQVEIRLYDMYRKSQWVKANSGSSPSHGRSSRWDDLFVLNHPQERNRSVNTAGTSRSNNPMNQMTNKLDERGERLAQMETKSSELADASKKFVSTIRDYNERQAKKSWWQI
ncbi:hypothetical protein BASA50_008786 [Batrachochytrium salamandrivorans]|uniref:V-SNARE coiled-coil homology domain-containing protein n=1 Tax=Batrachochytrium salamandrivorans TaxID=1357716 RepID=A0ABQ8F3B8_9FUNG|nr:hypothetical protein BASA50_008786 [Batrachochytrium salamandrivorans]KAJ1342336.1 hypothetical protein BSLG_003095 [Batrachochytrium salamandrivorans]